MLADNVFKRLRSLSTSKRDKHITNHVTKASGKQWETCLEATKRVIRTTFNNKVSISIPLKLDSKAFFLEIANEFGELWVVKLDIWNKHLLLLERIPENLISFEDPVILQQKRRQEEDEAWKEVMDRVYCF